MGGPSRPKDCLGGKHTPKYFGEKFMIPWAKNVLKNNPNLDDIVLPLLHAEMQRLEELAKQTKKGSKVKPVVRQAAQPESVDFPMGLLTCPMLECMVPAEDATNMSTSDVPR